MATALAATTAAALAVAVGGCGEDRSPEAYCKAFYSRAAPLRQSWVDTNESRNGLAQLLMLLSANGDLSVVFDGMVDHAPDDIRPETETVRDALEANQDSAGDSVGNPLGGILGGIARWAGSARSMAAVGKYLDTNCPVSSPLAQEYIEAARR